MNEILRQIRRTGIWIAAFAAMFVLMYSTVVMLLKYTLLFFSGFLPDADKNLLRLVFYGLSAACAAGIVFYKKRRYSRGSLNPLIGDGYALVKHLLNTLVIAMTIAEGPAVCGFFLVFLGKLYFDFYVLSAFSLILIYTNVPAVEFLEERLKNAV